MIDKKHIFLLLGFFSLVSMPLAYDRHSRDVYNIVRETPQVMPTNFLDKDGEPTGFETELLAEIVKRSGITVNEEFIPSFSHGLSAVKDKEKDMMMSAITITEEREKVYEFSRPYFVGHTAIVSKSKDFKFVADLIDKKVAVLAGSTHEDIMRKLKGDNADDGSILTFDTSFLAIKSTLQGETDAMLGDDIELFSFVERYDKYGLEVVIDEAYGEDKYGIAIQKGNTELKAKIDGAIEEMMQDGTYERIFKKWYPNAELPDFS